MIQKRYLSILKVWVILYSDLLSIFLPERKRCLLASLFLFLLMSKVGCLFFLKLGFYDRLGLWLFLPKGLQDFNSQPWSRTSLILLLRESFLCFRAARRIFHFLFIKLRRWVLLIAHFLLAIAHLIRGLLPSWLLSSFLVQWHQLLWGKLPFLVLKDGFLLRLLIATMLEELAFTQILRLPVHRMTILGWILGIRLLFLRAATISFLLFLLLSLSA